MAEFNYIQDGIFTVSDFFTPSMCDRYVERSESLGFTDAPINSAFGSEIRKDVRNNSRVMIDDQTCADDLWVGIRDYIPLRLGVWTACGINERFRFYRYEIGQQFDWHFDGHFERENGERSQLTLMVYLNDKFTGGETAFESVNIEPVRGLALIFLHKLRHKGMPVISGSKYVLRSDVMYKET